MARATAAVRPRRSRKALRLRPATPRPRNQADTSSSSSTGSLYEAGASTRRTLGWRAPSAAPNVAILQNLTSLRDRSREAVRNNGFAKGVLDKLVSNLIGTGIKPLSQAADPDFRLRVQALWLRWTDEADATGMLDYYGLQGQAVRAWLEGGESFTRFRPRLPSDGLSVPLQLQVLEPELCPHDYQAAGAGRRVRAGIEFDALGRRQAYWFIRSRPETDDTDYFDWSTLTRVPATSVAHLYDPLRPGQIRGLPRLAQALIALRELAKYDDATLLRQQLANLFVAFLKRDAGLGEAAEVHPLTGDAVDTTSADKPTLSLEPGIFQELDPGEEVQFSKPPDTTGYPEFMRQQLRTASAAAGVPYEVLTGDMTGVNDRTVRVLLQEFRRAIMAAQHQIVVYQFCRPIWNAWLDRVFISGALDIPPAYADDPTPWRAVKWVPQGWAYIQPVQDIAAQQAAIRAGLTSRSATVSEQGEDAETIDAEQAADNARADGLGLQYDSDSRNPKAGAGAGA